MCSNTSDADPAPSGPARTFENATTPGASPPGAVTQTGLLGAARSPGPMGIPGRRRVDLPRPPTYQGMPTTLPASRAHKQPPQPEGPVGRGGCVNVPTQPMRRDFRDTQEPTALTAAPPAFRIRYRPCPAKAQHEQERPRVEGHRDGPFAPPGDGTTLWPSWSPLVRSAGSAAAQVANMGQLGRSGSSRQQCRRTNVRSAIGATGTARTPLRAHDMPHPFMRGWDIVGTWSTGQRRSRADCCG